VFPFLEGRGESHCFRGTGRRGGESKRGGDRYMTKGDGGGSRSGRNIPKGRSVVERMVMPEEGESFDRK